jgi:predicted PurR-regulated permease PerM
MGHARSVDKSDLLFLFQREVHTEHIEFLKQPPMTTIAIYFSVTVLALYFMCVDKIYIIDQIEHHFPKTWMIKVGKHFRQLIQILGGYLKAEATLILISFIICLIGLYILKIFRI